METDLGGINRKGRPEHCGDPEVGVVDGAAGSTTYGGTQERCSSTVDRRQRPGAVRQCCGVDGGMRRGGSVGDGGVWRGGSVGRGREAEAACRGKRRRGGVGGERAADCADEEAKTVCCTVVRESR